MNLKTPNEFTSHLERREMRAVMVYVIVHVGLLPIVMNMLTARGVWSASDANFVYYAFGAAFMFAMCMNFLRREFDPLCDRPLFCMMEIIVGYFTMMCFNFCVSYILVLLLPDSTNPNNAAIGELVFEDYGMMKTSLMFFTPIVEEMLFRAGMFGMLRELSGRKVAYIVSVLLFALYHVWSFAVIEPLYWIYMLQYIPAGYLLARCYERTNSIWSSIFFHMMVNSVAVNALDMLRELV